MTTFLDLAEEVMAELQGYTQLVPRSLILAADLSDAALQVNVDSASIIQTLGAGLYEIDDELVYVTQADTAGGTLTVPPWGRGQQGTTAVAHSQGARVTFQPRFPRARVKRAINELIQSLFPSLYAVKTSDLTVDPVEITYGLPADVMDIIDVQWQTIGPTQEWISVSGWRMDYQADKTAFPTGVSIDLTDGMTPGQPIKVTYRARPTGLVNDDDDFDLTGLPLSCVDLVTVGTVARFVSLMDASRLQTGSVEQAANQQFIQAGSASNVGKGLMQMFLMRLQQESESLANRFHPRMYFTGGFR